METDLTADLSSKHTLSNFFKEHIIGMFIFAVATGIVTSLIYDKIKDSPAPTETLEVASALPPPLIGTPSTTIIKSNPASTSDSLKKDSTVSSGTPEVASALSASPPLIDTPSVTFIQSNPASTPDSLKSERLTAVNSPDDSTASARSVLYESKRAESHRTFQRESEAADRLMEQQNAEALLILQRDQGTANNARGQAQADAEAKKIQAMRAGSALIHSGQFDDGNILINSANVAYDREFSEIHLRYRSALNAADSKLKQTIADNKARYEDALLVSKAKYEAILSEPKR